MADKSQLWEYVKCQLRTDTTLYACQKAKENKKLENDLKIKLQIFEAKLSQKENIDELEYQEYIRAKSDWESHIIRKTMESF